MARRFPAIAWTQLFSIKETTMQRFVARLVAVSAVLLVTALIATADEEKVALDKLPQGVVDAVKARFPKAKLVEAAKEVEGGKTVFEVSIKNGKRSIDVTVSAEGKILSIEREIAVQKLPKAVKDAFDAKYPNATVKLVEEISKPDTVAAYELVIVTASSQNLEVSFDPQGKFLAEEKIAKKEEKKSSK
jgi:hypothetical protein